MAIGNLTYKECLFRFHAMDFFPDVFVLENYLDNGAHQVVGVISVKVLVSDDRNRGIQGVEKALI
jgi:hypothetical protein